MPSSCPVFSWRGAQNPAPRAARPAAQPQAADTGTGVPHAGTCVTCHNARLKSGGLALDSLDRANLAGHAEAWEKVVRKVRTGLMPPDGAPKPPAAAREAFAAGLENDLDRAAARNLDPGAPALHRLNRTEYANVVRDLLALDVDVSALLPPDDSAAGFDNIADVLGVSPALIEGYVAAAARVSRLAVGDPSTGLDRATYRVPGDIPQDAHVDGLPLGTRGGIIIRHTFPLDAEYDFQVGQAGGARLGGPGPWPARDDLYVAIDGTPVDDPGTRRDAPARGCRAADDRGRVAGAEPRRRRGRRLRCGLANAGHHAGDDRGALQPDRARRHAKPPAAPRLHARHTGRRARRARRRF